jgi:hypothetical protein
MRGETLSGHPLFPLLRRRSRLGCGSGIRNFDIQIHTKAGKVIWLNVGFLPVPSRKKDRFLFAHLFRDITKRMRILGLAEELHTLLAAPGGHPLADTTRRRSIGSPSSEVPDIPPTLPLSEREREILRLLAEGKTSKGRTKQWIGRSFSGRNEGTAAVGICRTLSVERGGAKQPWFLILELEMLAAASVGRRFSVALWGSFIRSIAPFCDSRKGSRLRNSLSCPRNQAESIGPLPSHCFEGSALPLPPSVGVVEWLEVRTQKQQKGAGERRLR